MAEADTGPATRIRVMDADITQLALDAIVNAANPRLEPGGGVCGAIHRAAGPELAAACAVLGGCGTGDAKLTEGFRLPARHVIHAVGPVWQGGTSGEDEALASCYRRSLELLLEHGLRTIAFPAISTGIYGFPPERAAGIAVGTVARFLEQCDAVDEVVLCCFGRRSTVLHELALARLGQQGS